MEKLHKSQTSWSAIFRVNRLLSFCGKATERNLPGKMAEKHARESTKVNDMESLKTALVQSNKTTRSSLRSAIRQQSKADQYPDILRSLQECSTVEENERILDSYLQKLTKGSYFHNKIKALKEVLLHLMVLEEQWSGGAVRRSSMTFKEAYEIYSSFFKVMGFTHQEKQNFQLALLNPKYGLKVLIYQPSLKSERIIVLRPSDVDLEPLLASINVQISQQHSKTLELHPSFVRRTLDAMDTEWDRCCASALLSVGRSTSQLEQLTLDASTANRAKVFVEEVLDVN